jgi:hypothetical protein
MTAQLTPDLTPGTEFHLDGTAYVINSNGKWHKNDCLQIKARVIINGKARWADLRILDSTSGWWNHAEREIDAVLNPKPKPAPKPKATEQADDAPASNGHKPSLDPKPDEVDQMTTRQLRALADLKAIELPAKASKPELVAAVKDALTQAA